MNDDEIRAKIDELTEEEKRLLNEAQGGGPNDQRHERISELRVERDRLWDFLRQREGREEFGLDPEVVHERDGDTVERFEG